MNTLTLTQMDGKPYWEVGRSVLVALKISGFPSDFPLNYHAEGFCNSKNGHPSDTLCQAMREAQALQSSQGTGLQGSEQQIEHMHLQMGPSGHSTLRGTALHACTAPHAYPHPCARKQAHTQTQSLVGETSAWSFSHYPSHTLRDANVRACERTGSSS